MKAHELREKTDDELRDTETELSERLFTLRLQQVTGQLENPAKIREVKRDLARVLTVLSERGGERAGATG